MSGTEQDNESALVCAARQGDREALRLLWERHWIWVKGLVYSILGNINDVDDALQNICVLLITKIKTLREPERFRPWLAVLARRAALSYQQQKKRRPVPLNEFQVEQRHDDKANCVVETAIRNEQHEQILNAVRLLPEKYREVFLLKYMSVRDLTYAEIAEILDIPVTTVQIRLVRARRMIYNRVIGRCADKVPRT